MSPSKGLVNVITAEEFVILYQPHPREWLIFSAVMAFLVGWPALRYRALRRATWDLAHSKAA